MPTSPTMVAADRKGKIIDWPGLAASGRSGREVYPLDKRWLIPLPKGSRLYLLPERYPVGFRGDGKTERVGDGYAAVAAFLPPGYTALSLSAFERGRRAPLLPLYTYCAVCWFRGKFHVPAVHVDRDPKHNPCRFDKRTVRKLVERRLQKYPKNRLVAHHGLVCALRYGCPNAANLFMRRWEAPIAVSGGCNASCLGCISAQPSARSIQSPQERIGFVPTVDEIVEIAVPHLKEAPRAIISFGQGCEGDPLLRGELIETAIGEIRKRTRRGTIHINTNGSMPDVVARLARAGLDSIRISLNSAREPLYSAYYHCRGYSFSDVMETFRIAREARLWTSINYLTFPGVTDDEDEFAAFAELLQKVRPQMIQWRNLNIDPDWYMDTVERVLPSHRVRCMGVPALMQSIRCRFPYIRFGYFNPPVGALRRPCLPRVLRGAKSKGEASGGQVGNSGMSKRMSKRVGLSC